MPKNPNTANQKELRNAWDSYLEDGNNQAREFILVSYLPYVHKIARRQIRRRPAGLDYDDLVQAGMAGLTAALSRYKPDTGASFITFASNRVLGSMLDEINSLDWTPRSVRQKIKLVLKAKELCEQQGKESANPGVISGVIQKHFDKSMSPLDVNVAIGQARRTYVHAIDSETVSRHEEAEQGFSIGGNGDTAASVEDHALRNYAKETMLGIIASMPAQDRDILHRYHNEGEPMRKIAEDLHLTVTEVSRRRRDIFSHLRTELEARGINAQWFS